MYSHPSKPNNYITPDSSFTTISYIKIIDSHSFFSNSFNILSAHSSIPKKFQLKKETKNYIFEIRKSFQMFPNQPTKQIYDNLTSSSHTFSGTKHKLVEQNKISFEILGNQTDL